MSYRILKITSFYKDFLNQIYFKNKGLNEKSYVEQYQTLMDQKYAWSDFFKKHIEILGTEVIEIIHNAEFLQRAWQKENNIKSKQNILYEQIHFYKPDVLFFQDIKSFSNTFIDQLRNDFDFIKLIFGHSCSPYSKNDLNNYKSYDFLITCLDAFKKDFERNGIKSYKLDHAFEPSILDYIKVDNHFTEHDFIFIGSFIPGSDFHNNRINFFEKLLQENIKVDIYGNIQIDSAFQLFAKQFAFSITSFLNMVRMNSINQIIPPLRKVSTLKQFPKKAPVSKRLLNALINESYYGIDMYKLLSKSKVTLNTQGGISGDFAANMRLFETTGVGSLLLTDHKKNIKDFFEPDFEIITYKSVEECIDKIKWLINNPLIAKEIAIAGQKRTLKAHNLKDRFYKIHQIILENLL